MGRTPLCSWQPLLVLSLPPKLITFTKPIQLQGVITKYLWFPMKLQELKTQPELKPQLKGQVGWLAGSRGVASRVTRSRASWNAFYSSWLIFIATTHFIVHLGISLCLVHQATPREPRAAIASQVLLTYPAHLGILPHAYLLCHYF